MAIRYDGTANEYHSRTTNLPGAATFTVTCWFRRIGSSTFRVIWDMENAGALKYVAPLFGGDGTTLYIGRAAGNGGDVSIFNTSADTWYFFAVKVTAGVSGKVYYAAEGAGSLTTAALDSSDTWTPAAMYLGAFPSFSTTEYDGRLAYLRIWDAALSDADVEAEWLATSAQRTADLNDDYPFDAHTDLTGDFNGRTFSATGTFTTEDSPDLAADQDLAPSSLDVSVEFGAPDVAGTVAPSSLDVSVELGAPEVGGTVAPGSLDTTVEFGAPAVTGDQTVAPDSLDVAVELGDILIGYNIAFLQGGQFGGGGIPRAYPRPAVGSGFCGTPGQGTKSPPPAPKGPPSSPDGRWRGHPGWGRGSRR